MDSLGPSTLEYIAAFTAGASVPLAIGYAGYKIRERLFDLSILRGMYQDGLCPQLDEEPNFWNIGRLSPFKRNSKFYSSKK